MTEQPKSDRLIEGQEASQTLQNYRAAMDQSGLTCNGQDGSQTSRNYIQALAASEMFLRRGENQSGKSK